MAWGDNIQWNQQDTTEKLPDLVPETPADDLLDLNGVAAWFGVTIQAFGNWVRAGHMPDGIQIGGKRRWSKRYLGNFIYQKFAEQEASRLLAHQTAQAKK